jgi:hypothetical protein
MDSNYSHTMKWLLALIAAALIAAAAIGIHSWRQHSVKSGYVNALPPYTQLRGLAFILEQDCYIFEFKSHESTYPLLGSHDTVPDLPAEVKASNVGADLPNVRILGILRTGDGFRIASVRQDTSSSGVSITFEIVLDNESSRAYYKLDAFWMMDHTPEKTGAAPVFLTSYAVPRVMM